MKNFTLCILFIATVCNSLAQELVYFPGFETINVHQKYQYVTSNLFRTYVNADTTYQVILPEKLVSNTVYTESLDQTKANAQKNNCTYYILADMSAIGNLLIVNMKMYETNGGEKIWSDMMKADELEDLDLVIQLLANAIVSKEAALQSGDIYTVTQHESNELKKRNATNSTGITLGGGTSFASSIKHKGMSGFAISNSFDSRDFILDLMVRFYFGDDITTSGIGMNILVPFTENDRSLFAGAGMIYSGTTLDIEIDEETIELDNSGLELEGHFGVILNRLSSVQLRATVSPTITLYEVNNEVISGLRFSLTANF